MSETRHVVLDANILVRAVFGTRTRALVEKYAEEVHLLTPGRCVEDARAKIPEIAIRRRTASREYFALLGQIEQLVETVDRTAYARFEDAARPRIEKRDPDDWPIVATALLMNAPIWTEDYDFFGCGVATWTCDRVEIYLRNN